VIALQRLGDAPLVTLRAIRAGAVAYAADLPRSQVQAASTEEWRRTQGDDPGQWLDSVLQNEWSGDAVGESAGER
jgi:hypothetical protein